MNLESIWTSTGIKLLHHPNVIKKLLKGIGSPVSLQIAPTSRCQLNCVFCSNANREKHEDLESELIIDILNNLSHIGLKTVEWTGGGDPTLYKPIQTMIMAARLLDLEQGFITNGIALNTLSPVVLNMLSWVRISMNCLDYVSKIDIPEFPGVLGFSYVINPKTTEDILLNLSEYVKQYNPRYVRIVPNCQASLEQQEENNRVLSETVAQWDLPYFYQAKTFSRPEKCWWGYLKPFILHDGYVYPCSSVVLNEDSEKTFHEKYRWIKAENIMSLYDKPMCSFPTENCSHCVFRGQNDMVSSLLTHTGMENFV